MHREIHVRSGRFILLAILFLAFTVSLLNGCARREGRGTVHVSGFHPTGETERYTNITIEFSRALVEQDSVDILFDTAPVEFNPTIQGRFRWIDTHTLRFLPTEPLQPSTEYTGRIRPQITDASGLSLRGEHEFPFHTSYFKVIQVSHSIERSQEDPTRANFHFTLEFNEAVAPEELSSHLGIQLSAGGSVRNVPYSVTTATEAPLLEVRSDIVPLDEDDGSIRLNIRPGLSAVGGTIPLKKAWVSEFSFRGSEELKVETVRAEQAGVTYAVVIRFSSLVDPDLARQFISIEPAQEFRISEYGTALRLLGNLQPGRTVTVKIGKGLRARDGALLNREFRQPVLLGDLNPSLGFSSPGLYLSREGLQNVGIELVNMNGLHLEVEKIYRNNLVHFLKNAVYYWSDTASLGKRIYEEEVPVSLTRNETHTVTVNFGGFLDEHPTGLFRLRARAQGRYWHSDVKTVLLTDIGMLGKRGGDELYVWILSTSTLEPLSGVEITLYSTNNQVLGRARTDAGGMAVLTGLAQQLEEFEPYVVTADRGEEFSFLLFDECAVATADFDIDGRPFLFRGYEAFIYGERGVYRPGETAHLACIIRSPGASVPPSFPVRLKVIRPDGRTLLEKQARTQESGTVEFGAEIPQYAPTGRYQVELFAAGDNPVGTYLFSVEEFIPDRIKVEVEAERESYRTGETARISVTGTMLFGPPAAGRMLEAMLRIEAAPFEPEGYSLYEFGDPGIEFSAHTMTEDGGKLDSEGKGGVDFEIPATLRPPAALTGIVQATVHESGGRAVSSFTTFPVHAYSFYIGLRREEEGYAEIGRPQTFQFVALKPDGSPAETGTLTARFSRLRWRSVLMRDSDGRYRYLSEKTEEPIETIEVTSSGDDGRFALTPPQWGQFRVTLTDPSSGSATAINFYASGWGYTPWSMEKPGQVDLELDKEVYTAGDEARLLVKAPFSGKLLLTVEREKILYSRMIDLEENTADIPLRVHSDYLPNVYVTATLVRSRESAEEQAPMRAWGTLPLMVNTSDQRLAIEIDAPSESLPQKEMEVEVKLAQSEGENRPPSEPALVTIAAVDEGILQLTGFTTPDPMDFFYGKKRLDVTTYDIFALLLPELEPSEIFSAPSGDRMAMMRMEHLSPVTARRVKPVALWSGLLPVDLNGIARTSFELPEFNGSLRLMVIATSGNRFGAASKDVRVRDPIVMTPTFPRFLAPDDLFRVPVNVFNGTGRDGAIELALEATGPVEIVGESSRTITVRDEEEVPTDFIVRAGRGTGVITFVLKAEGNGASTSSEVEVPVRPPSPPESRTGAGSIGPGEDTSFRIPSDWVPGSARYSLTVTPFPMIEFSGSLQELLRYPYGCVEQTTSQAFPLLYFKDLASKLEPELFDTNAPEYYVEAAIAKLVGMQLGEGGFSFWPNSTGISEWGSIYAMHFLAEARKAGYTIPDPVMRRGGRYLRSVLFTSEQQRPPQRRPAPAPAWSVVQRLRMQTYAAYVLALMDRPERGGMTYLFESQESRLTPESRFFLAGAFALSGDVGTAFRLLPASVRPQQAQRETGGTFSSSVRDNAIVLAILADIAPDHSAIPVLVEYLGREAKTGRWGTTQENAWAFLALGKIMRQESGGIYSGSLTINGRKYSDLEPETQTFSGEELGGQEIGISIEGDGRAYYYWEARGVPVGQTFREEDHGIVVRRRYLDVTGTPVRPDSIAHGTMVVVEIRVRAPSQQIKNVVLDDMLPAGIEIENPRLESRAALGWLPSSTLSPDYIDIRDDRLLLFLDLPQGGDQKFFYSVRAVTEGVFVLPPVTAECMYDPSLRSMASSGEVRVVRP